MKLDFDKIHYRIRTDSTFKKRLRNLVLFGGLALLLIVVLGLVFFSSAIIGLIYSYAPAAYELVYNYARDFASSFLLDDLTAILNPLTGGTNVNEMKTLITQYFEQLKNNPSIDFQNFQSFITTVKNSLMDNQITNTELELVRKFLLN